MTDRWIVPLVGVALPIAIVAGGILVLVAVKAAELSA